jgi:uncharacterized protein YecT (DUF1311 family)
MRALASIALLFVSACVVAAPSMSKSKPTPPVIKETFQLQPCPGKGKEQTTSELVGCAQREILRTDALINTQAKVVFGLLHTDGAKTRFVQGEKAWLAYRKAGCLSESDVYEGGSLSAVAFLNCVATRNVEHLANLRSFAKALRNP